jgi:SAM-dependent methyltransferase
MKSDNFIKIALERSNLDLFYIRTSIFNSLKSNLPNFKGKLLDIGCGKMPYRDFVLDNSLVQQYVGLDIDTAIAYDINIKADYTWDGVKMPFENECFETAFGTEVLEHCPNPLIIFNEVNRVLRKEGVFFFTIPFLWPLHEVPNDEFRFTPFALDRMLKETGFENITIKATGGWHASMAQMLGLWVKRSPLGNRQRGLLTYFLKPIIAYLIKKDKVFSVSFTESQMITGLSCIAFKK